LIGDTPQAVSRENVEVAQAVIAAWNARDLEAFLELQDPELEMTLPRNLLEGGSYRRHEGARQAFEDAVESWAVNRVTVEDMRAVDDRVVMLGRAFNVARRGGPHVDYELAIVMRVRDGKIVESRSFLTHDEALEAMGLRQ
jgi:ketosteroid isomerase-like protein